MAKQAGMTQCSSFVRNISLTELSHNLFCLKSSLKVAYSFEFLQQLCAGDGEERVKECKYMVLASAYSPTLQIRLSCRVLVPIHWLWGAVATQPSVALAIRPFLGWQDGAGCQILVTVLDTLSQIQAARQTFRLYLQNLCYLGGTN